MKHLLLSLTLLSSAVCTHSLTWGIDDHDILRSGGKSKIHHLSDKHSKCNDCATSGWCSFGRDLCNHRHGHNVTIDTDNVGQLQLAWTFPTTFNISAPVAAADGVLYFGEGVGPGDPVLPVGQASVYAVDAHSGTQIWKAANIGSAFFLTPAVGHKKVFFPNVGIKTRALYVSDGGQAIPTAVVTALDRRNGQVLWSTNVQQEPSQQLLAAPVLVEDEDLLFVCTGGNLSNPAPQWGSVVALRASTGQILWTYRTTLGTTPNLPNFGGTSGCGIFGTPAVDTKSGLLLIGTGQSYEAPASTLSDSLLALNYRTTNPQGELVWFYQFTSDDVGVTKDWDASCGPFLVTVNDRNAVIVGTKEGNLYALDRALGTLIWKSVLTNPNPTGSVFGGLQGFACTDGKTIYCAAIYSQTGLPLTGSVSVPATAIIALRVCDGAILWRQDVNGGTFTALTLANGVLYHNTAGERESSWNGCFRWCYVTRL